MKVKETDINFEKIKTDLDKEGENEKLRRVNRLCETNEKEARQTEEIEQDKQKI